MPPHANPILQTKLRQPVLVAGLLPRPRLLALLDTAADCTLTLVAAPAGSGKTSLVCQWLEQRALPVAWLQLDANDSDPVLFFTYLVHALRRITPQFGHETEILLQSARLPPLTVLANTLSNEIEEMSAPCTLVLDDYHLIRNPAIDHLLGDLVLRPPHGLHLIVLSRHAPAWPLARLRTTNRLVEVGTADLRFTKDETAAYLHLNTDTPLPDDMPARLQKQTEGWATGLQLAVLALQQTHDAQAVLDLHNGFVGSDNRYLLEYMADEVLDHLPADLLGFMQAASICSRFNVSLCQALTGLAPDIIRAHLRFLAEANLFLIALPTAPDATNPLPVEGRNWYRFHHLMQQILLNRLHEAALPADLAQLHLRAAAWLGAHGYVDEAFEHLATVEDWDAAAQLLLSQLDNLLNTEDRHTIERWLAGIPKAQIMSRPGLLLMQAWICFFNLDIAGLTQILNTIDEIGGSEEAARFSSPSLCAGQGWLPQHDGHVILLQGIVYYFSSRSEATIDATQRALTLLPASSSFAHKSAHYYLASAMQFAGRSAAAEELLLHAYRREQPKRTQASARLLFGLGVVRFFSGQLDAARESAQLLLQETNTANLALLEGWAHNILGRIDYERNRLASAAAHFAALRRRCYALHRGCAYDGFAGSMLLAAAQGDQELAAEIGDEWRVFEHSLWGLPTPHFYSTQARAALLIGDVGAALRWADTYHEPLSPGPMLWIETSHITKLRCLLASCTPQHLAEAEILAAACLAHAEHMHNRPACTQLTALTALLLDCRGERQAARALLAGALRVAQPEGYIRSFVDFGPPMRSLLCTIKEPALAGYIDDLLAAFTHSAPVAPKTVIFKDHPIATLTSREMEVLVLLATPLALREIGDKLFISYSTVRQHTAHIYEKLGVNKRRHAVLLAQELGLLGRIEQR